MLKGHLPRVIYHKKKGLRVRTDALVSNVDPETVSWSVHSLSCFRVEAKVRQERRRKPWRSRSLVSVNGVSCLPRG